MYRLILFRLSEGYFRHRWLNLLPILILLASGIAYILITKTQYTAQGVLYVQNGTYLAQLTAVRDNTFNGYVTPAQVTVNEVTSLLQTDAFIRAVIKDTKLEAQMNQGQRAVEDLIQKVRENTWVQVMGNNEVVFGAKYEDPQISTQIVSGMINGYMLWKTNGQKNEGQVALSFFTSLISQYKNELAQASTAMRDYLEAHPEPVRGGDRPALEKIEIDRLQGDINLAQTRYSNALEKEESARLSIAQVESDNKQTYMVIDSPHVPAKSATSRRELALQVGIFTLVGVLLSAGAIIGSAIFDRTFRVPADVQQRLSLPVLTVVTTENETKRHAKQPARNPAKTRESKAELAQPALAPDVKYADQPGKVEPIIVESTPPQPKTPHHKGKKGKVSSQDLPQDASQNVMENSSAQAATGSSAN